MIGLFEFGNEFRVSQARKLSELLVVSNRQVVTVLKPMIAPMTLMRSLSTDAWQRWPMGA